MYQRNHVVVTTGHKRIFGNKRPFPVDEKCEWCGRKRIKLECHFRLEPYRVYGKKRLEYHHWDNNDLSKGLWVCRHCHEEITEFNWMLEKSNKSNIIENIVNASANQLYYGFSIPVFSEYFPFR